MKKSSLVLFGLAVFLSAASLHAQGGCIDSPENPTVVLALVGSAGVFVSAARTRLRARRDARRNNTNISLLEQHPR